jgi:hypothetical protein
MIGWRLPAAARRALLVFVPLPRPLTSYRRRDRSRFHSRLLSRRWIAGSMGIFADEICPWRKLICDGLDAGFFPTVRIWLGQTLQILQTPLHLIEDSTKLVKGAGLGMGKIAGGHSTRTSRTINCRCAYPTVTNRLHGEREKDPEVLTSAVRPSDLFQEHAVSWRSGTKMGG